MRITVGFLAFLCGLLITTAAAREWSGTFNKGQHLASCVGQRVVFPWNFVPSADDRVILMSWMLERGNESSIIANVISNMFLPAAVYSTQRVAQVGNAGIALERVTVKDTGNYRVIINGVSASGAFFKFEGQASLEVYEKLPSEGEKLTLTLQPHAVKVKVKGMEKWTIALTCGTFTHRGTPPFPVFWTTPSGDVVRTSDHFKNGNYVFLPTPPVKGGKYSCRIPRRHNHLACLSPESNTSVTASLLVDETQVRLQLVDAEIDTLRQRQRRLEAENADMRATLATKTEVTSLHTQQTHILQGLNSLQSGQQNNTGSIQTLDNRLTALSAVVKGRADQRVAFVARPASDHSKPGRVAFSKILSNWGSGFKSSGVFTAPVAGLYFFLLTASPASRTLYSDSNVMKEGRTVCVVSSPPAMTGVSASCGVVVHLARSERVWVQSSHKLSALSTMFTGFLVPTDSV